MAALVARNDFERAKAVFKSGPSGASRRPRRSTASHAQRLQSQQNFRRVSQLFKKLDSGLSDPAVLDSSTTDQSAKVTNTLAQIEFSFNEAELNAQAQAILDKHPNADWKAKYEAEKQTRLAKEKEKDGIVERAVALEAEALQLKKEYTYMVKESIKIKEGLEAAATRERSQLLLEEWNFLLLKYNELAGHLLSSSNAQKEIQGQLKEFRESVESAIRRTRGDTGVLLRRARAMPKRKKPEITFKRAAQSVNEEEPTRPLVTADKVAKKPDPRVLQIHSSISVVNNVSLSLTLFPLPPRGLQSFLYPFFLLPTSFLFLLGCHGTALPRSIACFLCHAVVMPLCNPMYRNSICWKAVVVTSMKQHSELCQVVGKYLGDMCFCSAMFW